MATILTTPPDQASGDPSSRRGRFSLLWLGPSLLLLALWSAPLATGEQTLFLRDTLKTHLALRTTLGDALRAGELPLIDPYRAGGQGLVGNPNAVALYPDNLLLLVASNLWQLNAHFWLHWFVALGAAYWLAREWGCVREGAAAAAGAFAFSGFFVSQLNLYNGVAPVALAPALVAALLAARDPRRRRWALPLLGFVWALELLGGDPIIAALALAAAFALALPWRREMPVTGCLLALVGGALVAAPQWMEMSRLLPQSFRSLGPALWGRLGQTDPAPGALLDLFVPFFFGRPNSIIWGTDAFGGTPPLYFSLTPGMLAMALAAVGAGERRKGRGALLTLAGVGLLVTFSGGAVPRLLFDVPGAGLFRFAAKLFLWPALAAALLAGVGFERASTDSSARRRLAIVALGLAALAAGLVTQFALADGPVQEVFRKLFARSLPPDRFAGFRSEWGAVAGIQLLVAFSGWLMARRLRTLYSAAGALWVGLHALTQFLVLQPALPTDEARHYARRPALIDRIPEGSVIVHGAVNNLFGRGIFEAAGDPHEAERSAHLQLYYRNEHRGTLRSEFDFSPEGLDSFLGVALLVSARSIPDLARVRLLRATGVDYLLLHRPLASDTADEVVHERTPSDESPVYLYALPGSLEEAQLLGEVRYAPHVGAAFEAIRNAGFDPRTATVVAGEEAPRSAPKGEVRFVANRAESLELEAESVSGGVLVVRRAWLPIWRVSIDGRPVAAVVANGTRLAVELPPGRHTVRFWIDRAPFRLALAASALGLAGLVALFLAERKRALPVPS